MFKSVQKNENGLPQGLFCYAITPQAIATTVTVQPTINIANDCDFKILEIRASIEKAASVTGNVLMQMRLASGEFFSNTGINIYSFASMEQDAFSGYPIRLPEPIIIPGNSVIEVSLTNNNGETVTVQVQLWGYKIPRSQ